MAARDVSSLLELYKVSRQTETLPDTPYRGKIERQYL